MHVSGTNIINLYMNIMLHFLYCHHMQTTQGITTNTNEPVNIKHRKSYRAYKSGNTIHVQTSFLIWIKLSCDVIWHISQLIQSNTSVSFLPVWFHALLTSLFLFKEVLSDKCSTISRANVTASSVYRPTAPEFEMQVFWQSFIKM